uniref:Peptidoglycan-binding protein n=1 Tax=Acidobacterium capsulatum TaxID=33075 RepID=A0A7V4XTF8_9BACT
MPSQRSWKFAAFMLCAALLTSSAWGSPARHHHYRHHHYFRHHRTRSHHIQGQRSMAPSRVEQIQAALIREHYLTGEPNGDWNNETQAAMRKYQADHGWQTKLLPDARALIKLGLGPKVDETEEAQNSKQPQQPKPSISYADTLAAVHALPE